LNKAWAITMSPTQDGATTRIFIKEEGTVHHAWEARGRNQKAEGGSRICARQRRR
jgi:hypothetical protein